MHRVALQGTPALSREGSEKGTRETVWWVEGPKVKFVCVARAV